MRKIKLDKYEQEIEDNFDKFKPLPSKEFKKWKKILMHAAKEHIKKKLISLRISESDLKAIKLRASKQGLPYQTYINMLIHKDVTGQLDGRV